MAKFERETVKVEGGQVFRKARQHACPTPEASKFDIEDVFQCSECSATFVLTDNDSYHGGPYWKRHDRGTF